MSYGRNENYAAASVQKPTSRMKNLLTRLEVVAEHMEKTNKVT